MSWCENAIKTLEARLSDIESSVAFVQAATKARALIGPLMSTPLWQEVRVNDRSVLKTYYDQKSFTTGPSYRGLYTSISAAFEQFTRAVLVEAVRHVASSATTFDGLPESMRKKNMLWSGKLLAKVFDPPEEFAISLEDVCRNLGSCISGNAEFALNPNTFALDLPILSPDGLERALDRIDVKDICDLLGRSTRIKSALNASGPRDATKLLKGFLRDFSRKRNRIVHGADGEVPIEEQDIVTAIAIFRALGAEMPNAIGKKLKLS